MKKAKFFLSAFLMLVAIGSVQAQNELTEKQKVEFQNRVKQKVEEFQHALSKIVNKDLRHDIRRENVTNLFKLFIGEGEPYDYYDYEAGKDVHSTGVKIQTSSINRSHNSSQKLKNYIKKLYDPETGKSSMPYTRIQIDSASAVRVDNIEKVGDHYECVAYFCQKFVGYRDGEPQYSDKTGKKIRCYITSIDLPTGKKIWDAKLGDIYVLYTEKIRYK